MKPQSVRLIDVLILGPLMLYIAARRGTRLTRTERAFLGVTGAATIGYNLANYVSVEKTGCECPEK